jgi:secondary thiamine-phosphate synthase enzyme
MIKHLKFPTKRQGLLEITNSVVSVLEKININEGLCTLFLRHTSASLIIQENADPSARQDLENWLNRLVPENDRLYTHLTEGSDDMPSHIKTMLTSTSLSIPIDNGKLVLGTWQGIYIFEHRRHGSERHIVMHVA